MVVCAATSAEEAMASEANASILVDGTLRRFSELAELDELQ